MKIVFRDILHSLDFTYEAKNYQLDLSEILHELAEEFPDLQGKTFCFFYLHQPLEPFWSVDYLCKQFGLHSFDCIEIKEEYFLPLHQIKTPEDLLAVKKEHLAFALRGIPFALVTSHFPFLPPEIQKKFKKNATASMQEALEDLLKPSQNKIAPAFRELQEAFLLQGEMLELKEKEEKTTQKLKKFLRKKDHFLSTNISQKSIPLDEETILDDLHRLSSNVLRKQEELQQQEKQEKQIFEQFSNFPSQQKELLDALLEEEAILEQNQALPPLLPTSNSVKKTKERNIEVSKETQKVIIDDELFENSSLLQEDLPSYPAEIEKDTNSIKVLRPVDHLFEDLELPLNTPTGHNIDELFSDELPRETKYKEPNDSSIGLTSDVFLQNNDATWETPEIAPPTEPHEEETASTQKPYILSKQQLLVAGYALRKPPPGKTDLSSVDDSDANLPAQGNNPVRTPLSQPISIPNSHPTLPLGPPSSASLKNSAIALQRKNSKTTLSSIQKSDRIPSSNPYHFELELTLPIAFRALHPTEIILKIQTNGLKKTSSEPIGKIVLYSPELFFILPEFPLRFEKETYTFVVMATKPGIISPRVMIFIQQTLVGEFPLEMNVFTPPKKVAPWMLGVTGVIGSLGHFTLPFSMIVFMVFFGVLLFFKERSAFTQKTKNLSFKLDAYA